MKEEVAHKAIVKKPNEGFQMYFTASNVDVVFGGGILCGGKSWGLIFAMAEPLMTDPDFRGLISRKSIQSQKSGGGFTDGFKEIFGDYVNVKMSDSPRVSFQSGAFCDLTYIDDTNLEKREKEQKDGNMIVYVLMKLPKCLGRCLVTYRPVTVDEARHSQVNSLLLLTQSEAIGRESSWIGI